MRGLRCARSAGSLVLGHDSAPFGQEVDQKFIERRKGKAQIDWKSRGTFAVS
jgi:hypothetical protein